MLVDASTLRRRWAAVIVPRSDPLDGGAAAHLVAVLDDAERARYARARTRRASEPFLVGRALLRLVLADLTRRSPREVALRIGSHGKPELARDLFDAYPIHFSLAHSATHVVVAVSRCGPVGVDVETVRAVPDRMARRFFRPEEVAAIEALSGAERARAFFHMWVVKEACVKALGGTLGPALATIPASLEPRGRAGRLRWEMVDVGERAAAAVALDAPAARHALSGSCVRVGVPDVVAAAAAPRP